MIPMTLGEVAAVVAGRLDPGRSRGAGAAVAATPVRGAATVDSRAVEAGGLFVAVAGARVDGHDFARAAVEHGAVGVLGQRPTEVPTVVVEDPVTALGRLAAHVVRRLADPARPEPLTVLALTGSQGKTGTKDYLVQVLARRAPTVGTLGNHNNELGVPLTVLRATEETRYLVVEMGARGVGHIAYLCGIAAPTVAAVLNVGSAHIGEFGSRERIAQAKGEIVEALPEDGTAVLNADDPLTVRMAARTVARTLTFGRAGEVSWRDVTVDDLGRPSATFTHGDRAAAATLRQVGEHQLSNAAAAAALALGAGLELEEVVRGLAAAVGASRGRMELHEAASGLVVLDDSYNANPASMRAALDAATTIAARRRTRTLAVLGEMRELGEETRAGHLEVGEYAARLGVDVLLAVGDAARAMVEGVAGTAGSRTTGVHAEDRESALAWLREHMRAGDVVVVKASRAAELDRLAQAVVEENP